MAAIGFIGLGNMGAPMAANLLQAGHRVTGYDVVASARAAWAPGGKGAGNGSPGRGSGSSRSSVADRAAIGVKVT